MNLRWLQALLLAATLLLSGPAAAREESRLQNLSFDGEMRSYWLYAPAGPASVKPAAVLLLLHGSAGSGEDMMIVTQHGFEKIADQENLLVIYPNAAGRRWNDQGGTADDAGFLLAIVDKLATERPVDKNRVFIAGISSGGMMAQRMACDHADRVAAIATVAGSMPEGLRGTCKPSRPLSVLIIHGTADPVVPWEGGAIAGFEEYGNVLPARETASIWAAADQCRGMPAVALEPDRNTGNGNRVRRETFFSCAADNIVTLIAIQGGGHTWPGGFQYLPERFIGRTSRDIDANRLIWDFFNSRKD